MPKFLRLHPEHLFYEIRVVRKHAVKVVPDIIRPRLPDLYDADDTDIEKYAKIALLLFKPHRKTSEILGNHEDYCKALQHFQDSEKYKEAQADIILSNMSQYYAGRRKAKELLDAQIKLDSNADGQNLASDTQSNSEVNYNANSVCNEDSSTENILEVEDFHAMSEIFDGKTVLDIFYNKISKL